MKCFYEWYHLEPLCQMIVEKSKSQIVVNKHGRSQGKERVNSGY